MYLTGCHEPDAVLVMRDGEASLFLRPAPPRTDRGFFADARHGELIVGPTPSLSAFTEALLLETRPIGDLEDALSVAGRDAVVVRGLDDRIDRLVPSHGDDAQLASACADARRVKSVWEIAQLRAACDATAAGFDDCVRTWTQAIEHGERWVEGTFGRRARLAGNDVGYLPIVASGSHATILHWKHNTGRIMPGELTLLDMGVEGEHLYTADVTRVLPAAGTFTSEQRDVYDAVLAAQQAAIAAVRPGETFDGINEVAKRVLAERLLDLDVLPCGVEEAMDPASRVFTRWSLHDVSHMLGLDVHDCADPGSYVPVDQTLEPGVVFTIEPGLYFQPDDLLVPAWLRGIGVRLEDDILVTAEGSEVLTAGIPSRPADVEEWMQSR